MKHARQSGSTLLEFTLVGIPMMFVLISTFEVSRLAWNYHTLTAAVAEATRYAIVHGKNCGRAPNNCTITVGDVARRLHAKGVGLAPQDMTVTLVSNAGSITCRLDQCLGNGNMWPPATANEPGMEIRISASHDILSMIAMNWPGGGSVKPFGLLQLRASSREAIQY
ncbi:MAG: TadE family protein [Bryobacteraceae bacterium]